MAKGNCKNTRPHTQDYFAKLPVEFFVKKVERKVVCFFKSCKKEKSSRGRTHEHTLTFPHYSLRTSGRPFKLNPGKTNTSIIFRVFLSENLIVKI